jgi:hypothetical protein
MADVKIKIQFDTFWILTNTFGLADTATPTQLRYSSDEFAPLTIHQGDTVELDYSFLPGQAVSMASANGYQLFNLGLYQDASDPLNTSNFSVEGLRMSLSGVAGATLAPLHGFNQSGGTAHLGARSATPATAVLTINPPGPCTSASPTAASRMVNWTGLDI